MQYTNPEIPEGINTTDEHPLKEFSILLFGLVLIIALLVASLSFFATYLSRYIPFGVEISLTEAYVEQAGRFSEQEIYLQELTDRLSAVMDMPEGIEVTVHYIDGDVINAFATLGGHIVIYKGLLKKLPDENSVAMVLAHEIAHIKYRDPIASLGRGVIVSIALGILTSGLSDTGNILGKAGLYTTLKFNRDMEASADTEALKALQKLYGHVEGAEGLFNVFIDELENDDKTRLPQFFQTHPLEESRIERISRFRQEHPALSRQLTPLSALFIEGLGDE